MDSKDWYLAASFTLSLAAYLPLALAGLRGKKLSISAWLILMILNFVLVAGTLASGELNFQLFAFLVGATLTFLIALRQGGTYVFSLVDYGAVVLAAIGIIVLITGSPKYAIAAGLVASGSGALPLLRDAWQKPQEQVLLPWLMWAFGGVFAFVSLPAYADMTFANSATVAVFSSLQWVMVFVVFYRKTGPELLDSLADYRARWTPPA